MQHLKYTDFYLFFIHSVCYTTNLSFPLNEKKKLPNRKTTFIFYIRSYVHFFVADACEVKKNEPIE
jgi:hypothetical protein